jgi:hypothetical protein
VLAPRLRSGGRAAASRQSSFDAGDERNAGRDKSLRRQSACRRRRERAQLIETIKKQSSGKVSREEVARDMARILDLVDQARMQDVEILVEAELKKRGVTLGTDEQTGKSEAPVIAVDHYEPDVFDGEPAVATTAAVGESKTSGSGFTKFVDVLAELRGDQIDGP